MPEQESYDSLVNQKADTQAKYHACERRIENNESHLKRLKAEKGAVSDIKESFGGIKKKDERLHDEKRSWKGTNEIHFSGCMDTVDFLNQEYYKNSLDRVLDAINDEITRIENEQLKEKGLLGRLGSLINSLANEIENFFN